MGSSSFFGSSFSQKIQEFLFLRNFSQKKSSPGDVSSSAISLQESKGNPQKDLGAQKKTSQENLWDVLGENTWSENKENFESFQQNVIVYRCVSLMARNMARVPLVFKLNNTIVDNHPVLDLLKKPINHMGYPSFAEEIFSFLVLTGNAYIMAKEYQGHLIGLQSLHPHEVHCVLAKEGHVKAYEYRGHHYPLKEGKSLILHIKTFNPTGSPKGQSPLEPIGVLARLHTAITEQNLSLLENASCPSGALRIGRENLTTEDKRDLRRTLDAFREKKNGILLLAEDMEWQPLGLSPRDMDFYQGKILAAREICLAFGVPPMCLGIKGDATFSRHEEAFADLWENTLIPLMDTYVQGLTYFFQGLYKENMEFSYNRGDIHALTFRDKDRWRFVDHLSCLTINERRQLLGFESLGEKYDKLQDISLENVSDPEIHGKKSQDIVFHHPQATHHCSREFLHNEQKSHGKISQENQGIYGYGAQSPPKIYPKE